jgi:putative membrane protein
MKWLTWFAGLAGLALAIGLVAHQGWADIAAALDRAGPALLWLLPFHALPLLLDVIGWRVLLAPRDPQARADLPALFWIATIREACSRLLPVASIGGEIVGIRLVKWLGVDGAATAASVIVEVLLTLVNQYLFTAIGIVMLIALTSHVDVPGTALIALAASLPVPVALFLLLRHGNPFSRLESIAETLLGDKSRLVELIGGSRLDAEVRMLCSRAWRLAGACAWQLAGFVAGSFETWFALRLLGQPVGIGEAIAVEALTQALRHAVFIVPAGLGVQEGGLVLFGSLVGLPPDASVALSLVKRMREVAFGVPALISWQWAETRRLVAR